MSMYSYIGFIELTSTVTFLIRYAWEIVICHTGTVRPATADEFSLC